MSQTFKDWKGQLMGTFHKSPGGIKTAITKISAPNPEVCTVYHHHPHYEKIGTKAGPRGRMMSVRAPAPDVYEWLCKYPNVSMSSIICDGITRIDSEIVQALEFVVYAELKENVTATAHTTKQRLVQGLQANKQFHLMDESRRYTQAWKIEPWYFVDFTEHLENRSKTKRTWVSIETAELMSKLLDPKSFQKMDHDKMFSHLMTLKLESLVGIWLLKPQYFQVLQILQPDRWNQLFERANKGLTP